MSSADMMTAAAKAALRKKKQLEGTLEQTSAQIMNLEGQISSIETANINKETLDALKNASTALKGIHGGMTIDKVDATMYVSVERVTWHTYDTDILAGRISKNSTRSARKLLLRLPRALVQTRWTTTSWRPNLQICSSKSWTATCSRQAQYQSATRLADYRMWPLERVSAPDLQMNLVRQLTLLQSRASKSKQRRMTKRKNSSGCRPRWPCDPVSRIELHLT